MATGKRRQSGTGNTPGSVEDAANALKKNAEGGTPDGEQSEEGKQSEAVAGEQGGENAEEVNPAKPEEQESGEVKVEGQEETANTEEGEKPEAENFPDSMPSATPTAEEIDKQAEILANNPEWLGVYRAVLSKADIIIKERNAPAKLTIEELAAANYDRIVQKYGKDFVTAQKGNNKKYFTRRAWNNLGKNKQGWVEITKVMPEVQANTGK